jgi:hypothetical protein
MLHNEELAVIDSPCVNSTHPIIVQDSMASDSIRQQLDHINAEIEAL